MVSERGSPVRAVLSYSTNKPRSAQYLPCGVSVVMKPLTGISGKLGLDPELQPVGEPVFEFVDGGFAAAEHEVVLELQFARLDDRASDLEVVTRLRRKTVDPHHEEPGKDPCADPTGNATTASWTHVQLLCRVYGDCWFEAPRLVARKGARGARGSLGNGGRGAVNEPHKTPDDEERAPGKTPPVCRRAATCSRSMCAAHARGCSSRAAETHRSEAWDDLQLIIDRNLAKCDERLNTNLRMRGLLNCRPMRHARPTPSGVMPGT
jgi:hypothetical protein